MYAFISSFNLFALQKQFFFSGDVASCIFIAFGLFYFFLYFNPVYGEILVHGNEIKFRMDEKKNAFVFNSIAQSRVI